MSTSASFLTLQSNAPFKVEEELTAPMVVLPHTYPPTAISSCTLLRRRQELPRLISPSSDWPRNWLPDNALLSAS